MSNAIFSLHTIVLVIVIVAACFAIFSKKLLTCAISLGVVGTAIALTFMLLQAPDVAIAEAAVGAVLTTVLFIIAIRKTTKKEDEEK